MDDVVAVNADDLIGDDAADAIADEIADDGGEVEVAVDDADDGGVDDVDTVAVLMVEVHQKTIVGYHTKDCVLYLDCSFCNLMMEYRTVRR
mmetsp:Transcript_8413/g.20250  ORF Transcript_8413/g.20250 Transcript_8413/m.20250 type:complete len:91 (+) Transcript_8413:600-872(+)